MEDVTMSSSSSLSPPQSESATASTVGEIKSSTLGTGEDIEAVSALSTSLSPTQWSESYKVGVTFLISLLALVATMGITMVAPAAPRIVSDLGSSSSLDATLMITVWELGEAISPVTLGPLSEQFGRRIVYNVANALLVAFAILGALSDSVGMLIGSRFLCGFSIASTVLNSCMIGDMYLQDQRGTALSWMAMMPFIGPVLGPVTGGYISQTIGWRWNLWILAIVTALLSITFALVVHETYLPVIMQKHQTQRERRSPTIKQPQSRSTLTLEFLRLVSTLVRPFQMLLRSPSIVVVSLNWSVTLIYMQIIINTLNTVYDKFYHFSLGEIGLTYLGLAFGLIGGAIICSQTLDRYLKHQQKGCGHYRVKDRLPPIMIGTFLTSVAMIWFGWSVETHTFWLVPILATALTGVAFTATAVGTQSYLVDSWGNHAASALAGAIAIRNTAAAFFPLLGPTIWAHLGYGIGGTVLAIGGLAVVPVPLIVARYGAKL